MEELKEWASKIRQFQANLFYLEKDWDSVREINSYPPATGAYALYMKSTFYELFNNTADTYFHLEDNAINPIFKVNLHAIKCSSFWKYWKPLYTINFGQAKSDNIK